MKALVPCGAREYTSALKVFQVAYMRIPEFFNLYIVTLTKKKPSYGHGCACFTASIVCFKKSSWVRIVAAVAAVDVLVALPLLLLHHLLLLHQSLAVAGSSLLHAIQVLLPVQIALFALGKLKRRKFTEFTRPGAVRAQEGAELDYQEQLRHQVSVERSLAKKERCPPRQS